MEQTADRTIITVVGKDAVGIIAKVCAYLAENRINVLDISQTIVQAECPGFCQISGGTGGFHRKQRERRSAFPDTFQ